MNNPPSVAPKSKHRLWLLCGIVVICFLMMGAMYYLWTNSYGSLDGSSEQVADANPLPAALRGGPWQGRIYYAKRGCLLCDPAYAVIGNAARGDVDKWAEKYGLKLSPYWEAPVELIGFLKITPLSLGPFSFDDNCPYFSTYGVVKKLGYLRIYYSVPEHKLIMLLSTRAG